MTHPGILWLGLVLLATTVWGAPAGGLDGEPTLAQVEAAREAAKADSGLVDPVKPKVLEFLDQADRWLQEATTAKTELLRVETLLKQAPKRIKEIRDQLARSTPPDKPTVDVLVKKFTLEQAEANLSQEDLAMNQRREALKRQQEELDQLLVGSKALSETIAVQGTALEQIAKDLGAPAAEEPKALTSARNLALKSRKLLRERELALAKLRLASLPLLTNLAQGERDLLVTEIERRQPHLEALQQTVQRLREQRAQTARAEAEALKATTADLPPALQALAEENTRLHAELEQAIRKDRGVAQKVEELRQTLDKIKSDFERTRQRVDAVGSSDAVGKMLVRRRATLPSPQGYRRASAERDQEVNQVTDRMIELDELLRAPVPSNGSRLEWTPPPEVPEAERASLEAKGKELLQARQVALKELQKVYGQYISQLLSENAEERQLVEAARAFAAYIDDQLMWIPTASIAALVHLEGLGAGLGWYLGLSQWRAVAADLGLLASQRPAALVLLGLGLALLLMNRGRAGQRLEQLAQETRKIRTDSFGLTLMALGWSLVLVAPVPVLIVGLAWLLRGVASADIFTMALANGLIHAGGILASMLFLRQICRPHGLGDEHLRWPLAVREAVIRELRWLLPFAVPLGFLVTAAATASAASDPPPGSQILGQLAFIAGMMLSALFIYRILHGQGAMLNAARREGGGMLVDLHFLWFPALLLIPLGLGIASALGYHYTALHLEQRLELTFWFFVGLFLLKELLLRYLYLAERRLRYEDALRRREELRQQREQREEHEDEEIPPIPLDIPALDFAQLGEQAQRLVGIGFLFAAVLGIWSIWSQFLPVLGLLNAVELPFHATRVVEGIAKDMPVTLGDLTIGLIILVITFLAARNLPALLEILLLQRLPLDPGARYAINALSQYSIAGIGLFSAFSAIGFQWSNIQWLVAALSVGLGFGLQEIVANFISGIILLFERPIRVGDVVTIENTTGVVSRIRIRATTITNYDKQEFVVPNKQFITGRLTNWTLTDKMNRLVINVGVTYGTDVRRALELMLEAAAQNENVLKDPKPVVSFESFGDNALSLVLRCYLGNLDNRLATLTALHHAINDRFLAADIAIAFPQRDLHLDFTRPLEVCIQRKPMGRGEETAAP